MKRFVMVCTLGLTLSVSLPASAQVGPTVALTYELSGPMTRCPDERELRDLVVARLGRDPFVDAPDSLLDARLRLRVAVTADGRLEGNVELADPAGSVVGSRSITAGATECEALTIALVLATAILLDPITTPLRPAARVEAQPGPTHAPEASSPAIPRDDERPWAPRVRVVAAARVDGSVRPEPRPRPETMLTARVTAGYGQLPGTSFGAMVGAELHWSRFAMAFELGGAMTPGGTQLAGNPVETAGAWVALAPCLTHERWLWGCARMSLGLIDARPDREDLHGAKALVADAGARLGVGWPVGRSLTLLAVVDVAIPIVQPSIRIGAERVWTGSALTLTVGLGAALTL